MSNRSSGWHSDKPSITVEQVAELTPAIHAAVEKYSDFGRHSMDMAEVVDELEMSDKDLNLGSSMLDPVVEAIAKIARPYYNQLREENQ